MVNVLKESLKDVINWVIIFAAVLTFFRLWTINLQLKSVNKDVDKASKNEQGDLVINTKEGTLESNAKASTDIKVMNKPREDFNACGVKYSAWVQMISLFPLLGLFGTILGLMPGLESLRASSDLKDLYGSLSVALTSTFYGLIASIGLKLYVNFGPDKEINVIESKLEEFDRKLNLLSVFNKKM